jgi:hypothetical protein
LIAARGLAQIADTYQAVSRDWAATDKSLEAEKAKQKATVLREDVRKLIESKPGLRRTLESRF